jgi:hypothetical protein
MTSEEQRITLLEYLGWTNLTRSGRRGDDGPSIALRGTPPGMARIQIAPNPPKSLRFMHDLEKILTSKEAGDYDSWLWLIVKRDWEAAGDNEARIATWHATAEQRCEAWLRINGLWKRSCPTAPAELPPEPS